MSMRSDDDNCGNEDGEECSEGSLLGFFIALSWALMGLWSFFLLERYVPEPFFAAFFDRIGILRDRSACDRCLRSGCCIFTEQSVKIILCMVVPLPGVIFICWHLFCLPRNIARRRTQRAVNRLRRFPGQRRWHAGGWLVMMRSRHQRSLARSKGWPVRFWKLERYNKANIVNKIPPELELLEAGRSRMNFVLAVMAVVETNEEGLFRHIISFL
ncbi:unnamed protein product [Ectocarpus sp. 8 AP-2014]